jgi:hypothetical protein
MSPEDQVLLEQRRKFAGLVTEMIRLAAAVLEQEQAAVARRFPAMAQSNAILTDHAAIWDFAISDSYRRIVESYLAGELEMNLLSKVLTMLEQLAPLEFLRKPP